MFSVGCDFSTNSSLLSELDLCFRRDMFCYHNSTPNGVGFVVSGGCDISTNSSLLMELEHAYLVEIELW